MATYQIGIPDQGTNTYSSFLMYLVERDVPVEITDIRLVMNASGDLGCTDSSACNCLPRQLKTTALACKTMIAVCAATTALAF